MGDDKKPFHGFTADGQIAETPTSELEKLPTVMLQPSLVEIQDAIRGLKEKGVGFQEAVVMLVNTHKLTWNEAADRIRGAEAITGVNLDREDDLPEPSTEEREFMTHPLAAEINAMKNPDPDAMFCQICRALIPEKRRTRATSVCSEKCKNKLDGIRQRQRATRKCNLCLHPSTPEERAEFRQWRFERGDLKSAAKVVRDYTLPSKERIANELRAVRTLLQHEVDAINAQLGKGDLEASEDRSALQAKAEKFNKHIHEIEELTRKRTE